MDKFQEYIGLVVESVSIRKAASKIGVNMKTIFDWRHKLPSSLPPVNRQAFSGIVECDDKQLNINNKGSRDLNWKPYQRSSDRKTKRGMSNDVSTMVATDRKGNPTMKMAKTGRIDADSVENTIGIYCRKRALFGFPSIYSYPGKREKPETSYLCCFRSTC